MKQSLLLCLVLFVFFAGCAPFRREAAPITWKNDEDESSLYLYISRDASTTLMEMLKEPVSFEQVSAFLVENTNEKIPFTEGAMTSAALVAMREELRAEMEKKISTEGLTVEIIGFKENPVRLMKGALNFPDAPHDLVDFPADEHPEVIGKLLSLMGDDGFVVEVYGLFTDK